VHEAIQQAVHRGPLRAGSPEASRGCLLVVSAHPRRAPASAGGGRGPATHTLILNWPPDSRLIDRTRPPAASRNACATSPRAPSTTIVDGGVVGRRNGSAAWG